MQFRVPGLKTELPIPNRSSVLSPWAFSIPERPHAAHRAMRGLPVLGNFLMLVLPEKSQTKPINAIKSTHDRLSCCVTQNFYRLTGTDAWT